MLRKIAWRTKKLKIARPITSTTREWNNMIDVVFFKMFSANSTLVILINFNSLNVC